MPFKSEKQRKWMWANEPEMAEDWEDEEDKKREGKIMKITKRQLRRIIKEEKQRLVELGISRMEDSQRHSGPPPIGGTEDLVMEALEEHINTLAAAGNGAIEVETLLGSLVSRAVDIAIRDGIIQ